MKRLLLAALFALCLVPLAVSPVFAADVMKRISTGQLKAIISDAGYDVSVQKEGVLKAQMNGITVLFFIAENSESIQAYAGFKGGDSSLRNMNEWNKNKRFSRAYKDDEGDPVIELDLDFEGGITEGRVTNFLATVALSVKVFRDHIYGSSDK